MTNASDAQDQQDYVTLAQLTAGDKKLQDQIDSLPAPNTNINIGDTVGKANDGSLLFTAKSGLSNVLTQDPALTYDQSVPLLMVPNVQLSSLGAGQPVKTDTSKNLVSGTIDLTTTDVTGTLPVSKGGTGQVTLTNHAVLLGAGSAGIGGTGLGTTGQVLTSNGSGADPTFQTLPPQPTIENGIYSPSLTFTGTNPTGLTGTFSGVYTIINNRIFLNINITLTSPGAGGAGIALISIPFTNNAGFSVIGSAFCYNLSGGVLHPYVSQLDNGASDIYLLPQSSGGNYLVWTDMIAGTIISVSINYQIP
jgi:hypothetical protein